MKSDCHGKDIEIGYVNNDERVIHIMPNGDIKLNQFYVKCSKCHKPCNPKEDANAT